MAKKYGNPKEKKARAAAASAARADLEVMARQRGVTHAAALRSQAQSRQQLMASQHVAELKSNIYTLENNRAWQSSPMDVKRRAAVLNQLNRDLDDTLRQANPNSKLQFSYTGK